MRKKLQAERKRPIQHPENMNGRTEEEAGSIVIRPMKVDDLSAVAKVHNATFSRQKHSQEWVCCNFNAFPRIRYYLAEVDKIVVGYIQWIEKSGFRQEVILELEQIAVLPTFQRQGIGTDLIIQSLRNVKKELEHRQATIKHILVTTRFDNSAQKLYAQTLNAKPEAVLKNLFSADEVIMISRNVFNF